MMFVHSDVNDYWPYIQVLLLLHILYIVHVHMHMHVAYSASYVQDFTIHKSIIFTCMHNNTCTQCITCTSIVLILAIESISSLGLVSVMMDNLLLYNVIR